MVKVERIIGWLVTLALLAACGDDRSAGFTSGEAQLKLIGDLTAALDLTLADDRDSSFEQGRVSLAWEDAEGNFVSLTATPKDGEADARSDETPMLVNFVVDGQSFGSQATRTCAASFDQLTAEAISGTLSCSDLPLPGGAVQRSVSVGGTFSATA